jgi:HD-like signal output (HDOD) protein
MGRLAMFHADPEGLESAVERALAGGIPLEEAERDVLGYDHAATGGLLAERWNLPQEIVDAISQHHEHGGGPGPLGAVVAEADEFCIASGITPAYELPASDEGERSEQPGEVVRLMRRVDELMELVGGSRTRAA